MFISVSSNGVELTFWTHSSRGKSSVCIVFFASGMSSRIAEYLYVKNSEIRETYVILTLATHNSSTSGISVDLFTIVI